MNKKCGQCRQFTRDKASDKDICGAWGQPTMATRLACDFFMPAISAKNRVPVMTDSKNTVTQDI